MSISSSSFPLNLLAQRHQAEIIMVKCFIQAHNNLTRVSIEPRSCNQGYRKRDAFTLLATQPTIIGLYYLNFSLNPYWAKPIDENSGTIIFFLQALLGKILSSGDGF